MITHTIAAVILELAYLTTGILLCLMGRRLLESGVQGGTRMEGEIHGNKWVLLTSSPGVVFVLCGLGIIIYAIITPSEFEARLTSPGGAENASETSQPNTVEQTVLSKLFETSGGASALPSKVTIYALQHKAMNLANEDVLALVSGFPGSDGVEPWSRTHDRFAEVLRKNPTVLAGVIREPRYAWMVDKDRENGSLSSLLDTEIARLSNTQ